MLIICCYSSTYCIVTFYWRLLFGNLSHFYLGKVFLPTLHKKIWLNCRWSGETTVYPLWLFSQFHFKPSKVFLQFFIPRGKFNFIAQRGFGELRSLEKNRKLKEHFSIDSNILRRVQFNFIKKCMLRVSMKENWDEKVEKITKLLRYVVSGDNDLIDVRRSLTIVLSSLGFRHGNKRCFEKKMLI